MLGLGFLKSAKAKVSNAVAAVVVKIPLVGNELIKHKIISKLEEKNKKIVKVFDNLQALGILQGTRLNEILHAIRAANETIQQECVSDETLVPFISIIENHGDLTEKVKNSPSAKEIAQLFYNIISVKDYTKLYEMIQELEKFDMLPEERKIYLLTNMDFITRMQECMNNIDIDDIRASIMKMATTACAEIGLSEQEAQSAIAMFVRILDRHLPTISDLKNSVVAEGVKFIYAQRAKIVQAQPPKALLGAQFALEKERNVLAGSKRKLQEDESKEKPKIAKASNA